MKAWFGQIARNMVLTSGLTLIVTACSAPPAATGPAGNLSILSLPADFSIASLPDGWFLTGRARPEQISPAPQNPAHQLKVTSSDQGFALIRKTDAVLLATPYLSWRWKPEPGNWSYHPVRILIGFNDGGELPLQASGLARLFPRLALPPHDRGLSIIWGPSALMRGTLIHMSNRDSDRQEAYYTVRGGRENAGKWWTETVDLSHIYAQAWPNDDASRARIVFIGIGAAKSNHPFTSQIADIRLSR